MKITRITPIVILAATFFASCLYYSAPMVFASITSPAGISAGLTGYWPLDGATIDWRTNTFKDASGNGNNATSTNMSTTSSPTAGKVGQALYFPGPLGNTSVNLGNGTFGITNKMTVSAWVKTTYAGANYTGIVAKGSVGGSDGAYQMDMNTSGQVRLNIFSNGTTYSFSVSTATINNGKWHLVTGTYDGAKIRVYIDGVASGVPVDFAGGVNASAAVTEIGNDYAIAGRVFYGSIDDVRIYNRALSAADVAQLYATGSANVGHSAVVSASGLIGYWTFDSSQTNWRTNKSLDLSGNNSTGVLVNMATSTTQVAGKVGQAFNFSSSTQSYVDIANESVYDSWPAMSWCLWYKQRPQSGTTIALEKSDAYRLMINGNPSFAMKTVNNTWYSAGTTLSLSGGGYNTWHHVCFVYNGSNILGYLDGAYQTISTPAISGSVGRAAVNLRFGYKDATNTTYYDGYLDDARIYNRALTAADVQQLYNNGAAIIGKSATQTLASGLVGYWTLDGSKINWRTGKATDSSGLSNTGILFNVSTSTAPTQGSTGQALKFNGSTGYIIGSNTVNIPLTTVSAWVKISSVPAQKGLIVGFADGIGSGIHDKDLMIGTDGKLYFYVYDVLTKTTSTPAAAIPLNKWVHVAGTADGVTARAYVNGVEVGNIAAGNTYTSYTKGNILISGATGSVAVGGGYMAQSVDDVRVYNRALSAAEIRQLATTK